MPSVTINDTQGLLIKAGSGFSTAGSVTTLGTVSHAHLPTSPVQAITATSAIVYPGVYTVSSSAAGVLTVTLPLASTVPGGTFIFRNTSAHAHIVTSSAETVGSNVFAAPGGGTPGAKITNSAAIGDSIYLLCDGKSFMVLPVSGTAAIS